MDREIPVLNRVIHRIDQQRNNHILTDKIMHMKFANFSAFQDRPQTRSYQKLQQQQHNKINHTEGKVKRAKTVLNNDKIRQENKLMYTRLVNQKPTLSTKIFAVDRHKNLQMLKRIGRYPYRKMHTIDCQQEVQDSIKQLNQQNDGFPSLDRRHTVGDLEQQDKRSLVNIAMSDYSDQNNNHHLNSLMQQQNRKKHMILLWNKVILLNKVWYTIKFVRFKNHYQIQLSSYPKPKVNYLLKLDEMQGTAMLTDNDYDYSYISSHFIKVSSQYICLAFQLKGQKKKYFYRFQKKINQNVQQIDDEDKINNKVNQFQQNIPYRRTVFAMQNELREQEQTAKSNQKFRKKQQISKTLLRTTTLDQINNDDIALIRTKTNY